MNHKRMHTRLLALLLCCALVLPLSACGEAKSTTQQIFAMDTVMDLTAYGKKADDGINAAISIINSMDTLLDPENERSKTYEINHAMGGSVVVNEQIANGAVPDAVLPFKLTKDEAVERIRAFAASRRLFAHKRFKKEFVPENVLGVYLPYLVVDARAEAQYWGMGEVETRRWTEKQGDNRVTYYAADVYELERSVAFTVDDLTIEGSSERAQMGPENTNNIINAILPFDTKNAVKWNASYLVGFTSEKRDRNVDAVKPVMEDQLLSIGRAQVHGSLKKFDRGVRWERERIDVGGSRWVSMYLPVWLYSYRQESNGLLHYIAVNARTGETMGSIPVSQPKLILAAFTVGTFLEGIAGAFLVASA